MLLLLGTCVRTLDVGIQRETRRAAAAAPAVTPPPKKKRKQNRTPPVIDLTKDDIEGLLAPSPQEQLKLVATTNAAESSHKLHLLQQLEVLNRMLRENPGDARLEAMRDATETMLFA